MLKKSFLTHKSSLGVVFLLFIHNYYLYIYQEASGKEKLISCYKYGFCWSSVGKCVSTYIYFYTCDLPTVIAGKISRFSQNDYCCFRAGLFYFCCFDICWEILRQHRTLSARAYRLVIFTVWLLAILGSICTFFLLKFLSIVDLYFLLCLYGLSIVLTICGLNIGIWRKFQQKTVPHHQNRALQNWRLTKTLLFASLIASGSWIPTIVYNLIVFLGYKITNNIFLVTFFIFFFNSLVIPVVYALRIPESKQVLSLCFFTRREVMGSKGNTGTDEMAAALTLVTQQKIWTKDHSNLQLTFEQVILEDTKLWKFVQVQPKYSRLLNFQREKEKVRVIEDSTDSWQSPIFSWDRGDIARLTVNGSHLDFQM